MHTCRTMSLDLFTTPPQIFLASHHLRGWKRACERVRARQLKRWWCRAVPGCFHVTTANEEEDLGE